MAHDTAHDTDRGTAHGQLPFERRLPATTSSLADLRHTLRDWLDGTVDDDERRSDIVLAASELAAAAIRSVPAADAAVALRAWVDDGSVVLESRAEVGDGDFVGRPSKVFEGNDGERGFSIVAALSDVFAVKGMQSGVVVRARMTCGRFGTLRQG